MARTQAMYLVISVLVLISLLGFAAISSAAEEPYQEGVHYFALPEPVPTGDPQHIEVLEIFQYHCPHCYRFGPKAHKWFTHQPRDMVYHVMPSSGERPPREIHARLFFSIKALNLVDKLHFKVFDAFHKQKNRLMSEDEIVNFVVAQGLDKEQFLEVFRSDEVMEQVLQARAKTKKYQLTGTPALIVNGKYRVSPSKAVNFDKMLNVAEFLAEKEREALQYSVIETGVVEAQ